MCLHQCIMADGYPAIVMILQLIGCKAPAPAEVLKLVMCSCNPVQVTGVPAGKTLSCTDACSCQVADYSSNRVQCCNPFTTTVAAGEGYQEVDDDSASDSCDSDSDSQS